MADPDATVGTGDTASAPSDAFPDRAELDRHVIVIAVGVILVFALLSFLPDALPRAAHGVISEQAHARIESLTPASDQGPPTAVISYLDGARAGQTAQATVEGPSGQLQLPDYRAGDEVLVSIDHQPDGTIQVAVLDRWRLPLLLQLASVFALVTALVAGWRGLRAVMSLTLSLVLVVRLFIPLLLSGWDPLWLAIGLGTLVTIASFAMTQGINRSTGAAILGTTLGLAITGGLAVLTTQLAHFTPAQGSEDVVYLQQLVGSRIDLSGLLLAALIFGGLGVLNDVAISQAATVRELHEVNPALTRWQLYQRAMNVGIAHLAATVNTLVFAYLGTALPLLVLVALQVDALTLTVNQEIIAVEIVRTIVGAIGVLSAVPITTAIACRWLPGEDRATAESSAAAGSLTSRA